MLFGNTQILNGAFMTSTIDKAESQAETVLSGIQDKVEAARDSVKPALDEAWRKGEATMNRLGDAASDAMSGARKEMNQAADMVAKQPLGALLIAGAMGFVLARLLSR